MSDQETRNSERWIRMQRLRQLYQEMIYFQEKHQLLAKDAELAKNAFQKAQSSFLSYQEDIVGDLFNGCFGQEWLLVDLS
jgi:hypothetical protein